MLTRRIQDGANDREDSSVRARIFDGDSNAPIAKVLAHGGGVPQEQPVFATALDY
jgi:hypothetical protein